MKALRSEHECCSCVQPSAAMGARIVRALNRASLLLKGTDVALKPRDGGDDAPHEGLQEIAFGGVEMIDESVRVDQVVLERGIEVRAQVETHDSPSVHAQVLGTPEAVERTVGDAADTTAADSPVVVLGRPAGVPVVAPPAAAPGDGHTSVDVSAEALAAIADGDRLLLEYRYWPNDVPMRERVMLSPEGEVTWL